ncbi:hypothetical protein [Hydrogenobacter hydrogenophilus]|uniref:Uncharacterized protein n=1 Tax=Hydrogenobacter hydrogenophilus TaxID=35835 RepID=A0A285P3Y2_9AQUI|nr:hypothetical protein [Hydrogenobacter hydrogenophilus]SNZ16430.1 hypothetical protein SAMN06265353_1589 [Hydrogenobacter hydrogenophilus]
MCVRLIDVGIALPRMVVSSGIIIRKYCPKLRFAEKRACPRAINEFKKMVCNNRSEVFIIETVSPKNRNDSHFVIIKCVEDNVIRTMDPAFHGCEHGAGGSQEVSDKE